jgi:hypothetical protein
MEVEFYACVWASEPDCFLFTANHTLKGSVKLQHLNKTNKPNEIHTDEIHISGGKITWPLSRQRDIRMLFSVSKHMTNKIKHVAFFIKETALFVYCRL